MEQYRDIFGYIKSEEANFQLPVPIGDGWEWSMKDHIKTSFFYKNGRLLTGNADDKPVKNIVLPIRNLQDRIEDIDVKDVDIYVDDPDQYHLSFLIKKYHDDIFVKENDLDTFFDEAKEEKNDYGGSLVKNVNKIRPDVIPLQSIVFCDQTDILSGPIGLKHFYSADQLKEMEEFGWGKEENGATATVDETILLSNSYKVTNDSSKEQTKTPGKYIEVYEVHGNFPKSWIDDSDSEQEYSKQLHMVCFYKDENGKDQGITLFKGEEKELLLKFFSRERVFGRALGRGAIEELFEDQVWTNYSMIRKKELLDSAAKMIFKTNDPAIVARHPSGLKDLDNMELIELGDGSDINQVDTFPRNISLFDRFDEELNNHASKVGGATDPLLGEPSASGTPFRSQERQVIEGKGLHEARKKKYARFIEEVYNDWIIPYITKQLRGGFKFLTLLSKDEMEYVVDCVIRNKANEFIKEKMLSGQDIFPDEVEVFKEQVKEDFLKNNKKFIEILKDELKNVPLKVKVSVAGNKNLALMTDKLTNVFREVIANPTILDDPRASKIFNKIIEFSGLSPIDFVSSYKKPTQPMEQVEESEVKPVQPQISAPMLT